MKPKYFAGVGLVIGIAYAIAVPPGRVPDEVGHFWRSCAVAEGHLSAQEDVRQPHSTSLPVGLKTFVWVMSRTGGGGKFSAEQFRTAWTIPREDFKKVSTVVYPAHYTIAPYLAQSTAALIARVLGLRPFLTFYLGRLANLLAVLLLVTLAIRIAPRYGSVFAAAALLPMSMTVFASWSPDAPTIGWAFLLTALLLEPPPPDLRADVATGAVALMLALSKPAYFLMVLFAIASPMPRRRKSVVILVTLIGTAVAMIYAGRTWYSVRPADPVSPAAQIECIRASPGRTAAVLSHDAVANGANYLRQMIGQLGLLDVTLPGALIAIELVLLLLAGLASGAPLDWRRRLLIVLVTAGTFAGIQLSQYVSWSIACGDVIEGVQGRYFLPLLPLLLAVFALRRWRWTLSSVVVLATAAVCNTVAVGFVVYRFW
jgi:uncharacterized membrane protein